MEYGTAANETNWRFKATSKRMTFTEFYALVVERNIIPQSVLDEAAASRKSPLIYAFRQLEDFKMELFHSGITTLDSSRRP